MVAAILDWTPPCGCDTSRIDEPPTTSPRDFVVHGLDTLPGHARTWPGTKRIDVDRGWWQSLSRAQRRAVLAHELAHHDDPAWCESCADARAGARMRYAGIDATTASRSLASVVNGRRSGTPALWGWARADQRLGIAGETARALDAEKAPNWGAWLVVGAVVAAGVFLLAPKRLPWLAVLPGIP